MDAGKKHAKLGLNYSYRNNDDCVSTAILFEEFKNNKFEFVVFSKLPGQVDCSEIIEIGDFLVVFQVIFILNSRVPFKK